jgi:oligosaccharide repeat unit polymerase
MGFPLYRSWQDYILYPINYCLLPFLSFAAIDFDKYKKVILNALILSGLLMACTCLYLYRDWLSLGLGRISDINYIDLDAELISPLSLSYSGALTIILCCYYLFIEKPKLKKTTTIYLIFNIVVSFYIFLLGSSRGSAVAIVVCIPLFVLYLPMRNKLRFILILILSLPIILWAIVKTGSSILDRIESTLDSGDVSRGELWLNAWNEFINYPLLGNRIEIGFYPHNFILETLMATGIVGFFLLFYLLFVGIKRVYKISFVDKKYIIPFIILLQGICQYSFSGAIYSAVLIFFPLGLLIGPFYVKDNNVSK